MPAASGGGVLRRDIERDNRVPDDVRAELRLSPRRLSGRRIELRLDHLRPASDRRLLRPDAERARVHGHDPHRLRRAQWRLSGRRIALRLDHLRPAADRRLLRLDIRRLAVCQYDGDTVRSAQWFIQGGWHTVSARPLYAVGGIRGPAPTRPLHWVGSNRCCEGSLGAITEASTAKEWEH